MSYRNKKEIVSNVARPGIGRIRWPCKAMAVRSALAILVIASVDRKPISNVIGERCSLHINVTDISIVTGVRVCLRQKT
jgi:hypothetical protein